MARSDPKGDRVLEETTAGKPRKAAPRANANGELRPPRTSKPTSATSATSGARNEKRETPAPKSALARTRLSTSTSASHLGGASSASQEETPRWARDPATLATRARAREATMDERPRPPAPAVRLAATVQRRARAVFGPLVALLIAGGVTWVQGRRLAPLVPTPVLALALVSVVHVGRLTQRMLQRLRAAARRTGGEGALDFEISVLAPVGGLALASYLPGGIDGAGYAGVYAATAIVATFAKRATAIGATVVTLAVEAGIRLLARDPDALRGLLVHALVLVVLVVVNTVVLRGRIDAIGARGKRHLEREIERMRDQARSFRLHDGPSPKAAGHGNAGNFGKKPDADASGPISALDRMTSTHEASERVQRSGVEEIQIAVRFALDLVKRSLGAHSAILLFESVVPGSRDKGKANGALKVCEVVSDARAIAEGPFGMGDGVLGAVVRKRSAVSLHGLRAGYRVPYYPAPLGDGEPTSLVAVPIIEGGVVRGILCVDRLPLRRPEGAEVDGDLFVDRPFSAHEEEMVHAAARYILRAIENERVFGRLERAKAEQDHLYAATQRLSGALTEAEVLEAGVESARAIAAFDLAAITIVHDEAGTRSHEVRAVAGAADFEGLVGLRFGDNGGLVAQAVKARHSLPHRGDHDPATQVVFTRRHPLRIDLGQSRESRESRDEERDDEGELRTADVRSILVVPLILRDRVLGTLVLGARRRGAFRDLSPGAGARTTLEVLATHVATSLANARMFAKLEEMATTDGLTGLLNKRVLLELGVQKARAAVRYGKPLSVIQTDIDHFKKVNDTYGHDVGDQVIKGLAGILRRLKRGTDYVARFGGEEFVIICEETDAAGALHLAERVREELARTTFHATQGPFQVTCSLGVATFPRDGETWDTLYKATDEALYASKRAGRNRTTLASDLPPRTHKIA